jgi:glyoxylase-like metal-dependent hydrolase (beta-lactamase superfamily II)
MCPDTHDAIVVDPGGDPDVILAVLDQMKAHVKFIVNTHSHPDHILANFQIKAATGAPIAVHPLDAPALESLSKRSFPFSDEELHATSADMLLSEGDELVVGKVVFKVMHTPGHTRGHICLVTPGVAIVGDVLFFGSIGRTDFPGGSFDDLIASIRTKLFPLGDDTIVYPGHGPETTIGYEKQTNPFLT